MSNDTNYVLISANGRYSVYVDEARKVLVYDCRSGEIFYVEDFSYPLESAFFAANRSGTKFVFSLLNGEAV